MISDLNFPICFSFQVWPIAGLYIVDAAHQIFYSPDQDAINGMKIGLQQAMQAGIMLLAALTTSGAISEERGDNVCIHLSLVQVFLAIPEQLWGTVSFVTKKKGHPDEYEFKMTQKQINAVKVQVPSMTQRIVIAKQLYSEFRVLKQLVIEKETKSILKNLLSHPTTVTNMDSLFPYFIPSFFKEHLFSTEVKSFLYLQMKSLDMNNMTDAAAIIEEILGNDWEDCLDLRTGMDALMRLKATMNDKSDDHLASRLVSPIKIIHARQDYQYDDGRHSAICWKGAENPNLKNYDMFLEQLLTKVTSQEGFVEAFENILPEPVQRMVDKLSGVNKEKSPDTSESWNATEKCMLCFMAVMGLLSLSILTAMGMSADCECVCASGESPKSIWGVSFGLVSALPVALMALCMTVYYVLNKVRANMYLCLFVCQFNIWLKITLQTGIAGAPEPMPALPMPVLACDFVFSCPDEMGSRGSARQFSISETYIRIPGRLVNPIP